MEYDAIVAQGAWFLVMTRGTFLRQGYDDSTMTPTHERMNEHASSSNITAPKEHRSFFAEVVRFALIAIFIVLPIRLYIAQPFIVSGSSMDPTFANGEYLIVDEVSYRFSGPERGDVIIFRFPQDTSKFFIKRIIGLPGEVVEVIGSQVYITNDEYPNGLALDESYIANTSRAEMRIRLGDDEYFVMGDNRPASSDSRIWGPLDRDLIIGRAFARLLPVGKFDLFPGEHDYAVSVTDDDTE